MAKLRDFYVLGKPGIVYGNVLHALAGSFFGIAAVGHGWYTAVVGAFGVALVIASACAVNNITDAKIDYSMKRTKKRPTVTGVISRRATIWYAVTCGIAGVIVLAISTNGIVVWLGIVSYVWYTVLYAYVKRRSLHGTLVGTVPGALPIVAGYAAITGRIDTLALVLGAMLVAWQMVHFYAIAIFRKDEYSEAGVPVITVSQSIGQVKSDMVVWLTIYLLVAAFGIISGQFGVVAAVLIAGGGIYWAVTMVRRAPTPQLWARKVFGVSLILSLIIAVAGLLAIVEG